MDYQEENPNTLLDFDEWCKLTRRRIDTVRTSISIDEVPLDRLLLSIAETIKERSSSSVDLSEKIRCMDLIIKLRENLKDPKLVTICFASEARIIGLLCYEAHNNIDASRAFRLLAEIDDPNGKNNLAYMLRRGEVIGSETSNVLEALALLKDMVLGKDPFPLVNMGLTFALCFGNESDWKTADKIFAMIDGRYVHSICSWWEGVAANNEVEGYLVHLWLLRHNIISDSTLGTHDDIIKRVIQDLPNIPKWIAEKI